METKEEVLQNIKDGVATERGWRDWFEYENLLQYGDTPDIKDISLIDEVISRFAIAMCEEQRKACSESARSIFDNDSGIIHVDKQSILETKNVAE